MDKYLEQLEKRCSEQEQLISLLRDKLSASEAHRTEGSPSPRIANAAGSSPSDLHERKSPQDRNILSFVGSRRSDKVQAVASLSYKQFLVTRMMPEITSEILATDLMSCVEDLTSVICSKMRLILFIPRQNSCGAM